MSSVLLMVHRIGKVSQFACTQPSLPERRHQVLEAGLWKPARILKSRSQPGDSHHERLSDLNGDIEQMRVDMSLPRGTLPQLTVPTWVAKEPAAHTASHRPAVHDRVPVCQEVTCCITHQAHDRSHPGLPILRLHTKIADPLADRWPIRTRPPSRRVLPTKGPKRDLKGSFEQRPQHNESSEPLQRLRAQPELGFDVAHDHHGVRVQRLHHRREIQRTKRTEMYPPPRSRAIATMGPL